MSKEIYFILIILFIIFVLWYMINQSSTSNKKELVQNHSVKNSYVSSTALPATYAPLAPFVPKATSLVSSENASSCKVSTPEEIVDPYEELNFDIL